MYFVYLSTEKCSLRYAEGTNYFKNITEVSDCRILSYPDLNSDFSLSNIHDEVLRHAADDPTSNFFIFL